MTRHIRRYSVRVVMNGDRDIVDRTDHAATAWRIFSNAVRQHRDRRIEVRVHSQANTIGDVICYRGESHVDTHCSVHDCRVA